MVSSMLALGVSMKNQNALNEVKQRLEKLANKNLLYNWDFHNPVNQRGQNSYTGVGYTIDMWTLSNKHSVLTVNDGYISLTASEGHAYLRQPIEDVKKLADKTITISVYVKGNTGYIGFGDNFPTGNFVGTAISTAYNDWTLVSYTLQANTLSSVAQVWLRSDSGGTLDVKCIKLEIGETSTLKDDSPADYGEQLALCQRYLVTLNPSGEPYGYVAMGVATVSTSAINMKVPLPTQMRIKPSLSYLGNWRLNAVAWIPQSVNVSNIVLSPNSTTNTVMLIISANVQLGSAYYLNANNDASARIYLSAEI